MMLKRNNLILLLNSKYSSKIFNQTRIYKGLDIDTIRPEFIKGLILIQYYIPLQRSRATSRKYITLS